MRKLLAFVGLLVLLIGLLPYLQSVQFLSFLEVVPTEGTIYQAIIIAIGALTLYLGFKG